MTHKEKLLSLKSKPVRLDLEEGVTVWLRKWTLQEQSDYNTWLDDLKAKSPNKDQIPVLAMYERVITNTLCDENGKLLLSPEDWQEFSQCDSEFLTKILTECVKINGWKDAKVVEAKKD